MVAIDLYCGLGGWAEGFLAEGYTVIGFDIERHDYGTGGYPGQLVLQDVLSLHGSQFRNAAVIVASPPCQKYSYMAMPWSKAKDLRKWYLQDASRVDQLTAMFKACFRIQREASEAAGRYIPLIVENVRGAQEWVGRSAWNFGSYHLWGDIPALMPIPNVTAAQLYREGQKSVPHKPTGHWTNPDENGIKQGGDWFGPGAGASMSRRFGSKSDSRKAASAQIAKIPFPLARHIAQCFKNL